MTARYANACRIADKVEALLNSGYRVYDETGDEVQEVVCKGGRDIIYRFRDGGNVIMFMNDREWDNGALESIPEYTAQFAKWSFIQPKHIKPLRV